MGVKANLLLIIALNSLLFNCFAGGQNHIRTTEPLPHYVLTIELDAQAGTLDIEEQINAVNTTKDNWHELILSCPPAYYTKTFLLKKCALLISENTFEIKPRREGSMLFITPAKLIAPGEKVSILLRFTLTLPVIDPMGLPPVGNFGKGKRLFQAGDFYATLTPYQEKSGFMHWKYVPVGDPVIYTPSDYDVEIKAPEEIIIAAAGLVSRKDGIWKYSLKAVRSFAFLAAVDYVVFTDNAAGIPISSYCLKGFEKAGRDACIVAKRALTLYAALYGPYPYKELVIAQNAYLGAMEYSALCMESNIAYEYYNGQPRSFFVYVIAHEIAHQWWYGAVGNNQVASPWLDEALALFSEYLYYKKYHRADLDWWWKVKVINRDPHGFLDATIYDYPTTKLYIKNVYGLGVKFMADLYNLVGEKVFIAFLQDYRKKNQGKLATKEDFFSTLKKHTEKDLTPLQKYFKHPF